MKKTTRNYLGTAAVAALISFAAIGCTTVETRDDDDDAVTRSTTVTRERHSVVAPVGPAASATRTTTYRSY